MERLIVSGVDANGDVRVVQLLADGSLAQSGGSGAGGNVVTKVAYGIDENGVVRPIKVSAFGILELS